MLRVAIASQRKSVLVLNEACRAGTWTWTRSCQNVSRIVHNSSDAPASAHSALPGWSVCVSSIVTQLPSTHPPLQPLAIQCEAQRVHSLQCYKGSQRVQTLGNAM